MTSFNLNYFLEVHLQIWPHWELGLQQVNFGHKHQSETFYPKPQMYDFACKKHSLHPDSPRSLNLFQRLLKHKVQSLI